MEEANNANHSDMGDSGYSRGSGWRLLFASLALKPSQARRSPGFFAASRDVRSMSCSASRITVMRSPQSTADRTVFHPVHGSMMLIELLGA